MKIGEWRTNGESGEKEHHDKNVVYGIEESIRYVLEEIKTHGPYDGFLTFSQGSIFMRHMYRVLNDIDNKTYQHVLEDTPFPSFIISVAGLYFPYMQIDYKGTQYS